MSPCTQNVDSTSCCMHLEISDDDTLATKTPLVCEVNLAAPLRPCQAEIMPNCLRKESSFTATSETDLAKMNLFQQTSGQSVHSCSTIIIRFCSCMHQMSLGRQLWFNFKPCLSSTTEQKKEHMQRAMTMYFGNPTRSHEQHQCERNELPEPQIVEHPERQIVEHPERQIDEHPERQINENIEFNNDSGYGTTEWHQSVSFDQRNDLDNLSRNVEELSQCCFFYGPIDSQTSSHLLRNKPTGTFLLRESSDPRYLYSLSVKTDKGATSIRILYSRGFFQFDCDERIRHKLPQFETVLALIDFHVKATEEGGNKLWRWEQVSGCKSLKVVLVVPLKKSVPSLGHLARVQVNKCMNNLECPKLSIDKLPLEFDCLKEMLRKYPYQI